MEKLKLFWDKHKVFIMGLLGAVSVTIEQFVNEPQVDWKVIGYAALMAGMSYFGKFYRGQTTSIMGILGTLALTFVDVNGTGQFTWKQFILQGIVAFIALQGADAKSRGYESSEVIKTAKAEGEAITPAPLTDKPKV